MIKIKDLTFTYPGAESPQLQGINLEIKKGDFVAIVGNNGCGKSTLCKTLNGLIPHFFVGDFAGDVWLNNMNTKDYSIGELAREIGYVYQDFENQIVRPSVLDEASFACLNYAMPDYLERGRRAIQLAGLYEQENDYIWQLSGGQKHLLALAGAIALSPGIIVLDEPIAQLDPMHAVLIYDLLKQLNELQKITIIVIEHHTEFIADYCQKVIMMKEGRIEWQLPVKEALNRMDDLEAVNVFPPQITQATALAQQSGKINIQTQLPVTLSEGVKLFKKRTFKIVEKRQYQRSQADCVIDFSEVYQDYRAVKGDNKVVLDGLDLKVYRGEKVALIGSNGAGKSTILKLMTGLLKPKKGRVSLCDCDTREYDVEQLSKFISLVYQNPEQMFIKDNIREDIAFSMKMRGVPNCEQRTDELLQMFRLGSLQDKDGRLLSGGQMRRASLAVGIALEPTILLLDEPTANLDIATRREITHTLEDMKNIMETVVIATHDMQLVAEWADRIIVLYEGEVIADGSRDEIFSNERVGNIAGIRPPAIFTVAKMIDPSAICYSVSEFVECLEKEA